MNFFNWLKVRFGYKSKALCLFQRGTAKAKASDHQGAIDDYSTTIGMSDSTTDLRAMALYNRALVHAAAGDSPMAVNDLDSLLAMKEATVNIKTMARKMIAEIEAHSGVEKN